MRTLPLLPCLGLMTLLLAGCQKPIKTPDVVVSPDTRLVPAVLEAPSEYDTSSRVVEVRVPVHGPQLRKLPGDLAGLVSEAGPLRSIADAKADATEEPTPDGFLNAVQVYDYEPGVVYTAVTSPGFVTTIHLRPGEQLLSSAAGDTSRWLVETVEAGGGDAGPGGVAASTLLLVKPRKPYLETNLVITTDQRVYTLDLISVDEPVYHTAIRWNYPFDELLLLRRAASEDHQRRRAVLDDGVALDDLDFNYLILVQDEDEHARPAWTPLRAFDDGRKTYIQFPPRLGVTEAPPLFVLPTSGGGGGDSGGEAQLVNYRVRGGYYIVDRLFDRAELRLGEAPQRVVRIQRATVKH